MVMISNYEAMENAEGGRMLREMGFWPAWSASVPNGYHWTDGRWFLVREDFETVLGMGTLGLDVLWWSGETDCSRGSLLDFKNDIST
jgi:hypothetical protein